MDRPPRAKKNQRRKRGVTITALIAIFAFAISCWQSLNVSGERTPKPPETVAANPRPSSSA
jgi:hypothetical protein